MHNITPALGTGAAKVQEGAIGTGGTQFAIIHVFFTEYRAISPMRTALTRRAGSLQSESTTDICANPPAIIDVSTLLFWHDYRDYPDFPKAEK